MVALERGRGILVGSSSLPVLLLLARTLAHGNELAPTRTDASPAEARVHVPAAPADGEVVSPPETEKESAEKRFEIRRDKIYYGDSKDFSAPAVLAAARVYERIPEYRKIVDRKLTTDDPEYWPLMRCASRTFVRALKAVCASKGHDLVGEIDSIKPIRKTESVPEITAAVIDAVKDATGERRERIVRGAAGDPDADVLEELVNFPEL